MTARVLFHVQHLLGSGHLRRAAAIAAELARQGFAVELVSGGMPIADLDLGRARLIQLPPVRALDATFRTLVDEHGRPIDDTWKTARRELLLEQLRRFRPDVLVTELFPFGRGALAFEFVPLLEAAHELSLRPLILSSIRDVLVQKSDPRKVELAIERVRSWYDRVLVHGDPELIPLSATFPEHRLTDKLVYTGYVDGDGSPDVRQTDDGVNEVIVSVGGGAVGAGLLRMAIAAIPLSKLGNRRWRLLVGSHLDALARDALMREAGASCVIEPARKDFRQLLTRCDVSVSQAGYNTIMDVLTARARAVFVPFAAAGETEQKLRAEALRRHGWAQVVDEAELTPSTLARAVDLAAEMPRPQAGWVRRDGAATTARLVRAWLAERSVQA